MHPDSLIKVVEVPLDKIYHDEKLNCRGFISEEDILDLADEIREQGLLQPITLQPWSLVRGKCYRIVCGHRREAAFRYNRDHKGGPKTIPAIIHPRLTETDALILNLRENLNRKHLNVMQAARAVQRLKDRGMSQSETARTFKRPRSWAQILFYALKLPADIQAEIEAGYIVFEQIHELNKMTSAEQYEAVKHNKDELSKAKGKRVRINLRTWLSREKHPKAEAPDVNQIADMLKLITDAGGVNPYARALAWACGKITARELCDDFRMYLDVVMGKKWESPEGGITGL